MSGFDDVMKRLVNDQEFRVELRRDPKLRWWAPRRTVTAVAAIVALAASACVNGEVPKQSGDMAEAIAGKVDLIVLKYLDDNDIPGATVAATKNGRLVMSKGYGVKEQGSGEQMEPYHRAFIGSVSKVPTTIGLLQLLEQGKFELDDPLYASEITPSFGPSPYDPDGLAGLGYANDGILENPSVYLNKLEDAVENLTPVADPGGLPAYLLQADHQSNVIEVMDWASKLKLWHLLTHTSGLLGSGQPDEAAKAYQIDEEDLTYQQLHAYMLKGLHGPPLKFQAATDSSYSNHGFGVIGMIIEEQTGQSYHDYMQDNIFHPLGLMDITPAHVSIDEDLDASPHKVDEDGDIVVQELQDDLSKPTLGLATGGWRATAQDLARVMCGIDVVSNNLRLLDSATADTMATVLYPEGASEGQPLGWDNRYSTPSLSKGGLLPGLGGARITKYLPGGFDDVEINVAVVTNRNHQPDIALLRDIAKEVRDADISENYDLFGANHRCFVPPQAPDIGAPPDVQAPPTPQPAAPQSPASGASDVAQNSTTTTAGTQSSTTSTTTTRESTTTTTAPTSTTTTTRPPSTTTTTQRETTTTRPPSTTTTTQRETTTTTRRESTTTTTQRESTSTTTPREPTR